MLDIPSKVRYLIYHHLFEQANGEILALSREPEHDYDHGPPDDWIAGSRQEGLVYGTDNARVQPTNSRFLRTCRVINEEATPVFYGRNKIVVYAEDNNDIFYWLLDIGEKNRLAIRHLDISWAYGVSIESGRGNIRGILAAIAEMEEEEAEEIQKHREQLIRITQRLELKTVRLSKYMAGTNLCQLDRPPQLTRHPTQSSEHSISSPVSKNSSPWASISRE